MCYSQSISKTVQYISSRCTNICSFLETFQKLMIIIKVPVSPQSSSAVLPALLIWSSPHPLPSSITSLSSCPVLYPLSLLLVSSLTTWDVWGLGPALVTQFSEAFPFCSSPFYSAKFSPFFSHTGWKTDSLMDQLVYLIGWLAGKASACRAQLTGWLNQRVADWVTGHIHGQKLRWELEQLLN